MDGLGFWIPDRNDKDENEDDDVKTTGMVSTREWGEGGGGGDHASGFTHHGFFEGASVPDFDTTTCLFGNDGVGGRTSENRGWI